ncbi:MAG: hypothetical protein WA277_02530 [Nitrospirota bacterium]
MFSLFIGARFFMIIFISSLLFVSSTAFAVHELDDIDAIKKEIKGYDVKLKAIHTQKQEMIKKQDILTSEIKSLKEALKKVSGIIKEVQLKEDLKNLRSLIIDIDRLDDEEEALEKKIKEKKRLLLKKKALEIDELINAGAGLYKENKEKEADVLYKKALAMMDEHRRLLDELTQFEVKKRNLSIIEIPRTGFESHAELIEMSLILDRDVKKTEKEANDLKEMLNSLKKEKGLTQDMMRFQGVAERDEAVRKGNVLLKRLKDIDGKIILLEKEIVRYKEAANKLRRLSRELMEDAQKKEKKK